MKKVIVSPSLILEVVWVQQNIAAGNRHRSMRLIQSHWEPCLECNSILPDDPVEPAVELFFTTQHVKYACKGSHKRQRAGVEKKKSVLEQTCISFPWDEHKKKKKGSQQHTAATVCRHYRLGDNTRTFCFALPAFSFYPMGWREEETFLKSTNDTERELWHAPRDSWVTSEEDFNVWLWVF